jgi:anti-sigma factor RsiW
VAWRDSSASGHLGEDAAQLALGLLDGPARDAAVRHVEACAACRTEVAELSDAADALLPLVPSAEPPPGFEASVLDRLGTSSRRRSRLGLFSSLAAVAAALLLLAGIGLAIRHDDGPTRLVAQLETGNHQPAGTAWLDRSTPSVVSVAMAYDSAYQDEVVLTLEVVSTDGGVRASKDVVVRAGRGDAVLPIDDWRTVRGIRMTAGEIVVCHGDFQ